MMPAIVTKPLNNAFTNIEETKRQIKTQNSFNRQQDEEKVKKVVIESHYFTKRWILGRDQSNLAI